VDGKRSSTDDELERGWAELERGDARATVARMRALLADGGLAPEDEADARHLLGAALEETGDRAGMTAEWLTVLRLDAALDPPQTSLPTDEFERIATAALAELPREILDMLGNVPILIDERPSPDLVRDGIDPRTLGLFHGVPATHQSVFATAPPDVILLFQRTIESEADDEAELANEIRLTVLHETAHYFGFDEDQLERLGLG